MNKKPTSKSAFFNPRVLIGLAFCSIGLLLALLAFALYPGGNALAQRPEQDHSTHAHDPDPTRDRPYLIAKRSQDQEQEHEHEHEHECFKGCAQGNSPEESDAPA